MKRYWIFEIYDCVEWKGKIGSVNVIDSDYDGKSIRVDFADGSCRWFGFNSAFRNGLRKKSKTLHV